MKKLIKLLKNISEATDNNLTWEDRIKWDIKWIHYIRNRLVDINMFVFKFNNDNYMQVFKDYSHLFRFINRLYQIDNDIRYWIRQGMSFSRFILLKNRKAFQSTFNVDGDMTYRDGNNDRII